jgi:hypothetical protein
VIIQLVLETSLSVSGAVVRAQCSGGESVRVNPDRIEGGRKFMDERELRILRESGVSPFRFLVV